MVVGSGEGVPLGILPASASPAEVTLAMPTLATLPEPRTRRGRELPWPKRIVADKAYDSDPLRLEMLTVGIELIAPHRCNRTRPALQDGRTLRRYRRRWKIERLIAWLGNFRRLVVRYERKLEVFTGFLHVACLMITLRAL
jgi:transposase